MSTVFITGSGRRLGAGMAYCFAKKGYDVCIHYNQSKLLAEETYNKIIDLGVKSAIVKADVTNYDEMKKAFQEGIAHLGVPDLIINNAGVFPKRKSIKELNIEEWDSTLNINLRGEFITSKLFSEVAKNGKIINISSVGGLEVWKNRIPYNVSKAGVIQLTKSLARSLAPDFAVNCICPGTIYMENQPPADESEIDAKKIPMQRYGSIEDVFDAAYFFAECSNYITGQVITVDGGYSLGR